MARIRSIKPEYWTSEQVMELSRDARLAFIGLWNFCDDAGIHPANPKRLKAEVFPADDLTGEDVRRLVDELIALALIDEYEIEGQRFWIVTGWHHQKIEKPTYQHPRPDGSVPEGAAKRRQTRIPSSNSPTATGVIVDQSPNAPRQVADRSPPESSRVESNGVDKTIGSIVSTVNPAQQPDDFRPKDAAEWLRHFKTKHGFEADPTDVTDRKKLWPVFASWTNAGLTTAFVDAAVAAAQARAREPIACLPLYVDRLMASEQSARANPQLNAKDERRRAGWAELTGTQAETYPAEVINGNAKLIR